MQKWVMHIFYFYYYYYKTGSFITLTPPVFLLECGKCRTKNSILQFFIHNFHINCEWGREECKIFSIDSISLIRWSNSFSKLKITSLYSSVHSLLTWCTDNKVLKWAKLPLACCSKPHTKVCVWRAWVYWLLTQSYISVIICWDSCNCRLKCDYMISQICLEN